MAATDRPAGGIVLANLSVQSAGSMGPRASPISRSSFFAEVTDAGVGRQTPGGAVLDLDAES
jgi:hypothetical protein